MISVSYVVINQLLVSLLKTLSCIYTAQVGCGEAVDRGSSAFHSLTL